ncbi:MAG TPA: trimethylamine methyltransferase family protein, partial [candidate division Zixibacteria bacterium]|nr:trimethylamine methyltransferase family protein [candidate division Zixibacteria bacterium]
ENVGPGGHFLSQKHTREHIRDIWIPELTHPRVAPDGEKEGDIRKRARAKFDHILLEHEPIPLEEVVQHEIDLILRKAEEEIGR